MKQALLLLLSLLLFSCEPETIPCQTGRISFTLDGRLPDNGRKGQADVPSFLSITVKTKTGESVLNDKKISLNWIEGHCFSEPIELPVGQYNLTQLLVLNSEEKAIFGVPMKGSPFDKLVANPLPASFDITQGGEAMIVLEVLAITNLNAASVGLTNTALKFLPYFSVKTVDFVEVDGFKNHIEFQYGPSGMPASLQWSGHAVYPNLHDYFSYTEHRNYLNMNLLSLNTSTSVWQIATAYIGGQMTERRVYHDRGWNGVLKYEGTERYVARDAELPIQVKDSLYLGTVSLRKLTYSSENLTRMQTFDESGDLKKDLAVSYSVDLNPFYHLLETRIFSFYGHHAQEPFYYSKNLPIRIEKTRKFDGNYDELTTVDYAYTKDALGRVIKINATINITDNLGNKFLDNYHGFSIDLAY